MQCLGHTSIYKVLQFNTQVLMGRSVFNLATLPLLIFLDLGNLRSTL